MGPIGGSPGAAYSVFLEENAILVPVGCAAKGGLEFLSRRKRCFGPDWGAARGGLEFISRESAVLCVRWERVTGF